jgi:aminoglycoside phosphotransferase (APT) family kinase protein
MSARVDWLLPKVAAEIGVEIIGELGGGEFGAALARDRDGRELVLKAMEGEHMGPVFARGARLSALVKADDYPVPAYVGTGVAAGAAWSLQEVLPGDIPEPMTLGHLDQLLGFLDRHRDAAGEEGDVVGHFDGWMDDAVAPLAADELTASLAAKLAPIFEGARDVELRRGDVVHGDFHHRNFLAVGERVTAVFDWDMAWVGDWRVDLVNFADWSCWNEQIPDDVTARLCAVAEEACPAPVLAVLSALHTTAVTGFYQRVHPAWLPQHVANVEATSARWLTT